MTEQNPIRQTTLVSSPDAAASIGDQRQVHNTDALSESTVVETQDSPNDFQERIGDGASHAGATVSVEAKKRRKRRKPKTDAVERNLLGRRALCKNIADIAPHMLKTTKLRILGRYLDSTKGLDDTALTEKIKKEAKRIANKDRILAILHEIDPDVNRRNLKEIIVFSILLQEETHSLEETKLEQKVIEFEKSLVKEAKTLDFFDTKKHNALRWHHYDTYRIVLDAAWQNQNNISYDEACLLKTLRGHLGISQEEHWLIGCFLKRFPKHRCAIHSADEIHDARKQLQKESILWSYRDQNNKNIDVIPFEIIQTIRRNLACLELQETNYFRMVQHDAITVKDLRQILKRNELDTSGNKNELVERIVTSNIPPSSILRELDRSKLAEMCRLVGLKSSGKKEELTDRLIEFYDDLTFEERETQDDREVWFSNYELLASRAYSDLRAKKIISKDLEIEHKFEKATDFLFEVMLNLKIDNSRKISKADGRIPVADRQVILWDCKSVESTFKLQDYLESQFDYYIKKESAKGYQPLAVMVIAPTFSSGSLKLAHKYKAETNVDIALVYADALKYLADRWKEMEPKKSFPINLFNRTEMIDKEQVEFLLSLA